nr:putative disease resistance protein RGA1 [Ziziphus jujuba var. spinosa]
MAENILVSEVLQVVTDRLKCPLIERLSNMWDLRDNLERLLSTLPNLQNVLVDQQALAAGIWLQLLKDSASHVEDLLEDLTTINNFDDHHILDQQFADRVKEAFATLQSTADELQELPDPITAEHRELINKALPQSPNQLQSPPLFVAGGIPDLMLLEQLDLHGSLKITHLENEKHKPDSVYKGLREIKGLLLCRLLQLHNLKRFLVKGYPWTLWPTWKRSPVFNLTAIELIDCRNCVCLPSLGNLPLPSSLLLQAMHGVQRIGKEYCHRCIGRPFPTLRELVLIDFQIFEEWSFPDGEDAFPCLNKFNLTSLKVLAIEIVQDLSFFRGSFPANTPILVSLEIKSCPLLSLPPTFANLTTLKSLTVRWCEKLTYLPSGMQNINALESLEIGDCHRLKFLTEIGTSGFNKLRTLSIENCKFEHLRLLSSVQVFPDEFQNFKGLHSLEIKSCPGLEALPEWIEKLISLRSLAISDCHNITSLLESIHCLTGLQHLSIQDCPRLLEKCRLAGGEASSSSN